MQRLVCICRIACQAFACLQERLSQRLHATGCIGPHMTAGRHSLLPIVLAVSCGHWPCPFNPIVPVCQRWATLILMIQAVHFEQYILCHQWQRLLKMNTYVNMYVIVCLHLLRLIGTRGRR